MRILMTLAAAVVLLGPGCSPPPPPPEPPATVLFEEKFGATLADGWSKVREDEKAWRLEGGALHVRALPGSLWEKENTAKNVFVRALPAGADPVAIEVVVTSAPVVQAEQAGLLWYGDDDHYIKLVREFTDNALQAVMVIEDGTKLAVVGEKKKLPAGDVAPLRLVRKGGKLTGQYKGADGAWKDVGTCDVPAWEAKAALFAHGAPPPETDRWARFGGFRITKPAH
jgi:regulation of enolase protein 1 (concanavalin A-like superfamily)